MLVRRSLHFLSGLSLARGESSSHRMSSVPSSLKVLKPPDGANCRTPLADISPQPSLQQKLTCPPSWRISTTGVHQHLLLWQKSFLVWLLSPLGLPNCRAIRRQAYLVWLRKSSDKADGKALQKAMRPKLLSAVWHGRTAAQFGGLPGLSLTLPSSLLRAHLLWLHHERRCGGAVFVDVRTAYYSVLRDLLSATSSQRADPEGAEARAAFLFREPHVRADFVRRLREQNPLLDFGASPETLRYVQSQIGETWFVSRTDASTVFKTGTGTAPGAPIADTLFALVFRDFLISVQEFLDQEGIGVTLHIPVAGDESVCYTAPMPTWADDTCVLFQAAGAADVSAAITCIAAATQRLLRPLRLSPNFNAGKTEVIAVYHGCGAKKAKQHTLCDKEPAVAFTSQDGSCSSIRVVAQYPHLGTIVRGDLHEVPNIRARERLMLMTFRPLRRRILTCQDLSQEERVHLVRSRVFPRFLHQAGLWRLGTAAEVRIAHEALRKVIRSSFRPILGRTAKGLSNEEVAAALGMPLAEEMFEVERARALREIVLHDDPFVWHVFRLDGVWLTQASDALRKVLTACHPALLRGSNAGPDCLREAIRCHPHDVRLACKAFLKHCIALRTTLGRQVIEGVAKQRIIPVSDDEEDATLDSLAGRHTCEVCQASFRTRQQLGLHRARAHRLLAGHTNVAFGTTCQVCVKEYWTLKRLQQHLKKNPSCQRVYYHADMDPEVDKPPNSSDPCRAWRPVCEVFGPRPFWATLNPEEG